MKVEGDEGVKGRSAVLIEYHGRIKGYGSVVLNVCGLYVADIGRFCLRAYHIDGCTWTDQNRSKFPATYTIMATNKASEGPPKSTDAAQSIKEN